MRRLSFRTAGESHGRGLLALLEGVPAGLALEMERDVDPELRRRQGGYGRGGRRQNESDSAGLPVGLGSYASWDAKLDGRLAGAVTSIHAVKGVEIGLGFEGARRPGSEVHDPILRAPQRSRTR